MKRLNLQSRFAARRQSGFTLLEIMVVITLIAIIMGVVATNVLGSSDKAKSKLAQAQINNLAAKIESYELDNGQPPERLEDLVNQPSGSTSWLGPYAKESELKDPWNNPIEYRRPGTTGKYDLISFGADGQAGGSKFAADIAID